MHILIAFLLDAIYGYMETNFTGQNFLKLLNQMNWFKVTCPHRFWCHRFLPVNCRDFLHMITEWFSFAFFTVQYFLLFLLLDWLPLKTSEPSLPNYLTHAGGWEGSCIHAFPKYTCVEVKTIDLPKIWTIEISVT